VSASEARELPACGPGGVRCIGGVSSSQALGWDRRTCRLDTNVQMQRVMSARWSPRGRSPRDKYPVGESTDARHRGGLARSSDEGPVIGPKRRGQAGQVNLMPTLRGRS
jgi:hypothetical protein